MGEYFKDLGGAELGDGWTGAEGWRARVLPADDYVIGSIRVGRIRLQLEGTPEVLARIRPLLDLEAHSRRRIDGKNGKIIIPALRAGMMILPFNNLRYGT
ncbi:MAG: hypothetical protein IPO29_15015 [Anaerolineae bacterium]|nr:hypothetical protein [Anaerolineae bacterium]